VHFLQKFTSSLATINENDVENIALELFRFQAANNPVYYSYLKYRGVDPTKIASLSQIPFLPISFFKNHSIVSGNWKPEIEFSSSGTTGSVTSRHLVWNLPFYLSHAEKTFEQFFGPLQDYHFLALLPSYLEREGSSLIAMMTHFIKQSRSADSGFYLYNQVELLRKMEILRNSKKKVIVWGVSFALLDLAEKFEIDLSHCTIIETGGMKGRRKEWIREELHEFLCRRLNVAQIGSEYGMTELLSQAYSFGIGQYQLPNSMKIVIRDINDPYQILPTGRIGAINIVDLANAHSCAFIETQDLGKIGQNGYFEVLGRMDNSDLRGCNLLVE
jgi:phenylacetate-coenzyme A ligase PaaK-like adenylate-forming protein